MNTSVIVVIKQTLQYRTHTTHTLKIRFSDKHLCTGDG